MNFSQTSPKDRTARAASFPVISALGMGARWPKKPAKILNFKVFFHLGQNVWGEMGGGDGGGSMLASHGKNRQLFFAIFEAHWRPRRRKKNIEFQKTMQSKAVGAVFAHLAFPR